MHLKYRAKCEVALANFPNFAEEKNILEISFCAKCLLACSCSCRGTFSVPAGTSQEVSASGCAPHLHLDSKILTPAMWESPFLLWFFCRLAWKLVFLYWYRGWFSALTPRWRTSCPGSLTASLRSRPLPRTGPAQPPAKRTASGTFTATSCPVFLPSSSDTKNAVGRKSFSVKIGVDTVQLLHFLNTVGVKSGFFSLHFLLWSKEVTGHSSRKMKYISYS